MLAHLINTLLIVAVLACPMCCHAGMCCGLHQEEQAADRACCKCCPNPTSPEDGKSPAPCDPNSGGHSRCQGICGGAVLEKAIIASNSDFSAEVFLSIVGPASFRSDIASGRMIHVRPALPSGRFVRQLHESLLC